MAQRTGFGRSFVGVILAGIFGLAACTSSTSATTSTPGAVPTSTTSGLVTHVAPSTNLRNGDIVHVSVSGFPPGKAFLSECAFVADVNAAGCGAQLAAQSFIEIEYGGGSESFNVSVHAPSTPLSQEPSALCTDQCVLLATSGVNPPGVKDIAVAKLVFGS
jgi:hypothetical protein